MRQFSFEWDYGAGRMPFPVPGGIPVYRDMFGRGSITGTAMQKTVFFDTALKFKFT
jgi:hypothetical protein